MKILLTGAKGMLGSDFCKVTNESHEVIQLSHHELDICNLDAVIAASRAYKPNVIINCAAYTNVDGCETNSELAFAINGQAPKNLAIAASECSASLLHISTDYVFDGAKGSPYIETDLTNPMSVYGKSKLLGERNVSEYEKSYVVRTQWLYGHNGNNFVKTILRLAKERGELKVVDDQVGHPTNTMDLAIALAKLIECENFGMYHITNSEEASWFAFTKEILSATNLNHVKLSPCKTSEFPRPAKRPSYAPLENKKWNEFNPPLRSYKEAVQEYCKI